MTQYDAFIAAVCQNPEDLTPRLVFADWLDEHQSEREDFAERAELIRVQCKPNEINDRRSAQIVFHRGYDWLKRDQAMIFAHDCAWLKYQGHYREFSLYRRGFVEFLRCTWEYWAAFGTGLRKCLPLRHVMFYAPPRIICVVKVGYAEVAIGTEPQFLLVLPLSRFRLQIGSAELEIVLRAWAWRKLLAQHWPGMQFGCDREAYLLDRYFYEIADLEDIYPAVGKTE